MGSTCFKDSVIETMTIKHWLRIEHTGLQKPTPTDFQQSDSRSQNTPPLQRHEGGQTIRRFQNLQITEPMEKRTHQPDSQENPTSSNPGATRRRGKKNTIDQRGKVWKRRGGGSLNPNSHVVTYTEPKHAHEKPSLQHPDDTSPQFPGHP